ncbi:MFS transporter [Siccirubricoccus deserti]|uniref:Tripartite tricarboxylate transporter substrate binding protein n=1 Tax=Siccirubricoccus deserti TaxID=2013562 RepID=A0A9X0R068_9PROT|nr:tripartite tricarboxylate transporter substrate binding protein [Siccirubricoccus deserti]MBC4017089.1 tripartite tricarboxylate transporter substrate binding protein [Siccirubricoccus deserti]GGC56243.1 MFS transporter [Siccirubricoccus deserti]
MRSLHFMPSRRGLMPLVAGLALPSLARAQAWPARPVRLVVPFPPGGGTDTLGRMVARAMGEALGQPVVVENRGGAGGNIGSAVIAQAPPDGYHLLFNGNGMAVADLLFRNPGYDFKRDFTWVARTASTPILLVVNEHVPVRTVPEFIAYARANPGKLNHGTAGAGTPFHLGAELFNEMAGTRLIHVPYRGTGPSVAGLLGNEVQLMFASSSSVDALIRDGKVRALANTAARRARGWPELPSIAETLPGYSAELWYPVAAPAGTLRPVVEVLERVLREVMREPNFVAGITQRGFDPEYLDSAGTLRALEEERTRWAPIVARAGITAE